MRQSLTQALVTVSHLEGDEQMLASLTIAQVLSWRILAVGGGGLIARVGRQESLDDILKGIRVHNLTPPEKRPALQDAADSGLSEAAAKGTDETGPAAGGLYRDLLSFVS